MEPSVAPRVDEQYPAPALLPMSAEENPHKRGQLLTGAWVSVGWILLQVVIAVLLLATFATWSNEIEIDPAGL